VTARRLAAAASLGLALSGCAGLRELLGPAPEGRPGARDGWLAYEVAGLAVEVPAGWRPSGGAERLSFDVPGGVARLEVTSLAATEGSDEACLEAAEAALERGAAGLTRVRRHRTSVAGRPAVVQEADQGGWHGWAYGLCRAGRQYRLFFAGRSPIEAPLLADWREVLRAVRFGGSS
jgi:hypothetical protein